MRHCGLERVSLTATPGLSLAAPCRAVSAVLVIGSPVPARELLPWQREVPGPGTDGKSSAGGPLSYLGLVGVAVAVVEAVRM